MMKNFYIVALLTLTLSQQIFTAKNIHSTLVLEKKHSSWLFNNDCEIRRNPELPFENVIKKWQKWVDKKWAVISAEICKTFDLTEAEFTGMLHNEEALRLYKQLSLRPKLTTKRSRVLAFIKHSLRQHSKAKFKVIMDPELSTTTRNVGASPKHFVLCSPDFFSEDHINYIYDKSPKSDMYYSPHARKNAISCINLKIFIPYILAVTASHINHDKDFFGSAIHYFTINKQQISEETQIAFEYFCYIRSAIEAVFQSANPLEVALFLHASVELGSPRSQPEILLWKEMIKDLRNCYHPEDLEEYMEYMAPNLEQAKQRSPF